MAIKVLTGNNAYVQDTDTGLIFPSAMVDISARQHPYSQAGRSNILDGGKAVTFTRGTGVRVRHDDATGVAFWPAYASGLDDMLMRALVRGSMANGAQTPVIESLLSTIVSKRQAMAGTWTTTVTGKKTPVSAFLDVLARADDSGFGPTEFVQNILGALDVDNRGAFVAQVPFHQIPFDKWDEYGMDAIEIVDQEKKASLGPNYIPDMFYLQMSTEAFRANQGLWTIDGLDCYPTGNPAYPFYISKWSERLKKNVWVAIPREIGFTIIQHNGGQFRMYAGFGQSGAWRFSPWMIKYMAVDRMDWEHLIAQPPRGVVWAAGLDTPTQFKDQLYEFQSEREDDNVLLYPGVFFGGSVSENAKIFMVPWTEPPAGYTPETFRTAMISALAASFHMNETHLQMRVGQGAVTQAGIAEALEAETSISWMRHVLEHVYNQVAPPRLMINVIWQSDRTTRYMIESFKEFSLAVSRLQKPFMGAGPNTVAVEDPVFTREEIRAMVETEIGLNIPTVSDGEETASSQDAGDVANGAKFDVNRRSIISLFASTEPREQKYAPGQRCQHVDGRTGTITGWAGQGDMLWVRFSGFHGETFIHSRKLRSGKDTEIVRGKYSQTLEFELSNQNEISGEWVEPATMPKAARDLLDSWLPASFLETVKDAVIERVYTGQTEVLEASTELVLAQTAALRILDGKVPHGADYEPTFAVGDSIIINDRSEGLVVVGGDLESMRYRYSWDGPDADPRAAAMTGDTITMEPFDPEEEDPLPDFIAREEIDVSGDNNLAAATWAAVFAGESYSNLLDGWDWNQANRWFERIVDDIAEEVIDIEDLRDLRVEFSRSNSLFQELIDDLLAGSDTVAEWEENMRSALALTYLAMWLAGVGGTEQITAEHYDQIEDMLYVQYAFLRDFAERIIGASYSEAQISYFISLYFWSSLQAFESGRLRAYSGLIDLPAHPGDGSSECLASDQCYWELVEDDVENQLLAYWVRTAQESCPTCIRREGDWAPLVYDLGSGDLLEGVI